MLARLAESGIAVAAEPGRPGTVAIAVATTVDEALRAWPAAPLAGGPRLLVADALDLPGVLRAVRAGVHAMLRTAQATAPQ
jgi:hypothetical protein